MALDFPDNPTDGEVYVASNGIQYTYNAATDSWTGALGSGSSYWSEVDDGSGNIYVTDTNAYVGIGTDAPTNDLTIVSDTAKGLLVNAGSAQADDTNKALHVTNADTTDTFSVSYKGFVTFGTLNLEDLADLPE